MSTAVEVERMTEVERDQDMISKVKQLFRVWFNPDPEDFVGVADVSRDYDKGFRVHKGSDYNLLFEHAKSHFTGIEASRKSIEEKAEKLITLNVALAGSILALKKLASDLHVLQVLPSLICCLAAVIACSLARRVMTASIPTDPRLLAADWRFDADTGRAFLTTSYGLAGFITRRQLEWRSGWFSIGLWATVLGVLGLLLLLGG